MFVNNTAKKEIELRSFEGYKFYIPVGVSWIMDKVGQHLLDNIYNVKPVVPTAKDKILGLDQGYGVPPLLLSTEEAWTKGGKQLARVERFRINGKQVPRKSLITVAQQRGVLNARILEYLADPQIDAQQIAEDINNLPVPDEVRFPKNLEQAVPQMVS